MRCSPVVLNPNSRGQETAKARTQTEAIMMDTRLRELCVVLYRTGITTAVYLREREREKKREIVRKREREREHL